MREGHRPLRDARRCAYGRALRLLGDEHPGATATTTFAEFRQRGPPSRLPGTGGSAHGPHFGGGTRMPLLAAERPERGTPGPQGGPSKGRPQVVRSVDRRESSRKRFRKRKSPGPRRGLRLLVLSPGERAPPRIAPRGSAPRGPKRISLLAGTRRGVDRAHPSPARFVLDPAPRSIASAGGEAARRVPGPRRCRPPGGPGTPWTLPRKPPGPKEAPRWRRGELQSTSGLPSERQPTHRPSRSRRRAPRQIGQRDAFSLGEKVRGPSHGTAQRDATLAPAARGRVAG
jgi:hypothetical protein